MPEITVNIPGLLMHCTDGQQQVRVAAENLQELLDNIVRDFPLLKVHLYEDDGSQREHVLFFYNDDNTHWLEDFNIALSSGDRFTILQAVTGG